MKHLMVALLCSMGLVATAVRRLRRPNCWHPFISSSTASTRAIPPLPSGEPVDRCHIVDEVPPYLWQGPGAFKAWAKDLDTHDKSAGMTDQQVTLGKVSLTDSTADNAYVAIAAVYSYKQNGSRDE